MAQMIRFFCSSVLALFIGSAGAWAEGYLSALPDMPLAAGLSEMPDEALLFDKPEGRILRLSATRMAAATDTAIRQFYVATLPNLGWRAQPAGAAQNAPDLTFTRKGENLRITLRADRVIFDLAPKP